MEVAEPPRRRKGHPPLDGKGPSGILNFKAPSQLQAELRRVAAAHGTKPSTLARALVERGLVELSARYPTETKKE